MAQGSAHEKEIKPQEGNMKCTARLTGYRMTGQDETFHEIKISMPSKSASAAELAKLFGSVVVVEVLPAQISQEAKDVAKKTDKKQTKMPLKKNEEAA